MAYYTITVNCNISSGRGVVGAYGYSQYDVNWSGRSSTTPAYYETSDEMAIEVRDISGYSIKRVYAGSRVSNLSGPYSMSGGKYWTFNISGNATINVEYEELTQYGTLVLTKSGSGTVTGAGDYPVGTTVNISATASSGYRFSYWLDEGGSIYSYNRNTTIKINTASIYYLTAVFTRIRYGTVILTSSGHGTVEGGGTAEVGTSVDIEAYADSHYHFDRWVDESGGTYSRSAITTFRINAEDTYYLTATFEEDIKYHITAGVAQGSGTFTGTGYFYAGESTIITAIPARGYKFLRWSDGVTTTQRRVDNIQSDRHFSAYFEKIIVKLSTKVEGTEYAGISVNGREEEYRYQEINFDYGSSVNIVARPISKYDTGDYFSHYIINGSRFDDYNLTFTITENTDVVAYYIKKEQTVQVNSSSYGTTIPAAGTYTRTTGSLFHIKAIPNAHYDFLKWQVVDGSGIREYTAIETDISSSYTYVNITPIFTLHKIEIVINIVPDNGGSTTPSPRTYEFNYGESLELNAFETTEGYIFEKWTINSLKEYKEVTESNIFFEHLDWLDEGYYTAYFKLRTTKKSLLYCYSVPSTGGQVVYQQTSQPVPEVSEHYVDSVIDLVARPKEGYEFAYWTSTAEEPSPFYNYYPLLSVVMLETNVSRYAHFVPSTTPKYYLKVNIVGNGTVIGGNAEYYENTFVNLIAIADEGYHFYRWNDDYPSNSRTELMTSDIELTVYFVKDGEYLALAILFSILLKNKNKKDINRKVYIE